MNKKDVSQRVCCAKRLIYVTTAGGAIYDDLVFEYVKALTLKHYVINEVLFLKVENPGIDGNDVTDLVDKAKDRIDTESGSEIIGYKNKRVC